MWRDTREQDSFGSRYKNTLEGQSSRRNNGNDIEFRWTTQIDL